MRRAAVIIITILFIAVTAMFAGCGKPDEVPKMGDGEKRFVLSYSQNLSGVSGHYIDIYEDTVTGVQYVFRKAGYSGGLTPLLDANGQPYRSESAQ